MLESERISATRLKALLETSVRRTDRAFLVALELKSGDSGNVRDSLD